jgi:multidrug transporter EmrE-like cation transporter
MNSTPFSSMLWVLGGGVIGSIGAVGLKSGAMRLKLTIPGLLSNWRILGGIVAYLASSVLFMKGMKYGQLSVLYPLVAVGQIWTLLWGRILFKEKITNNKLIAVALILVGVALIGYGNTQASQ